MIDLFEVPKIDLPTPSFVHRCEDDPDEELDKRERKLAYYREWHRINDKKKAQDAYEQNDASYKGSAW